MRHAAPRHLTFNFFIAMFLLISYDIENDKTRNRVAKTLEDHGTRVQFSVFECNLTDAQYAALKKKLAKLIKPEDSIRYYRLCQECVKNVEIVGEGELTQDKQYYLV
jgi:CRISPR-associated protein Cas2